MKKYILATFFFGVFLLFLEPAEKLLSNFLRLEQPTIHEIQTGDWLSKISKEYYGDVSYWRELELINRAPDGDWIYPGEKVVIPSFAIIERIRNARRMSEVNDLVAEQQEIIASYRRNESSSATERYAKAPAGQEAGSEGTLPEDDTESGGTAFGLGDSGSDNSESGEQGFGDYQLEDITEEAQSSPLNFALLGGIGLMVIALVAGFVIYLRKRRESESVEDYSRDPEVVDEDATKAEEPKSIYFDFEEEDATSNNKEKKEVAVH